MDTKTLKTTTKEHKNQIILHLHIYTFLHTVYSSQNIRSIIV